MRDSDSFIINGDQATAYHFARLGYDVWLGKNRGNKYSRKHTKLSPDEDSKIFFDYSFFELAKFDAPAMIDYVI